jgi:phage-related protein
VVHLITEEEREYVAYEGWAYTVEWYFDAKNKSQALNYYQSLNEEERRKVLMLFKRMGDAGVIRDKTKFVHEGDKIYAFKPQPDRFLCFFHHGKKIIVTNAFRKKQQKLPKNEKERAMKIQQDYLNRTGDNHHA